MFKQMTLRILLILIACWTQSIYAASASEGSEPKDAVPTVSADWSKNYNSPSMAHRLDQAIARPDLRTDKPLLFSIGNLRIMGTQHNLPISIFSPRVMGFFETMQGNKHLHEHESMPQDENCIRNIGGLAETV